MTKVKRKLQVAIQGGIASYHDMAVREYFKDDRPELIPCKTFRSVCERITSGDADLAMFAIENTLVGSILPNYLLLLDYPVQIIGEKYLHIEHCLLALPGQKMDNIKVVRSHPMALMQCSEFLENYPKIQQIETEDTADSAREIVERGEQGIAAIAGELAAKQFGLEILASDIEDLKNNYTRFVILSRRDRSFDKNANKATLNFRVKHKVGALVEVLEMFKTNRINLTLIQSIPIPGKFYEYSFHVDLEWTKTEDFEKAVREVDKLAVGLQVLGMYRKGEIPYHAIKNNQLV